MIFHPLLKILHKRTHGGKYLKAEHYHQMVKVANHYLVAKLCPTLVQPPAL